MRPAQRIGQSPDVLGATERTRVPARPGLLRVRHARAPFIDGIFHTLRGLLLQTFNMSEAVLARARAHAHQFASFPADVAGQARVAVDFQLRSYGRGRVIHGRLTNHILQIFVLGSAIVSLPP